MKTISTAAIAKSNTTAHAGKCAASHRFAQSISRAQLVSHVDDLVEPRS
jgi:hypothetical protein